MSLLLSLNVIPVQILLLAFHLVASGWRWCLLKQPWLLDHKTTTINGMMKVAIEVAIAIGTDAFD